MPNHYWDDVVATVVHLLNRMPIKVLTFQTPLKVLFDHVPLPTMLLLPPCIFSCVVFVHLHRNQRTKLDPCPIQCLFLGYGVHKKGYHYFDPTNKRTYITMDVTFLESDTFFPSLASNSTLQEEHHDEDQNWLGGQQHLLGGEGLDVGNNPTYMNNEDERIKPNVQGALVVPVDPRDESVSAINVDSADDFPHLLVPDPTNLLLRIILR